MTKAIIDNSLWIDPHFGSRLDRDVQAVQEETNRKKYGTDSESDPNGAPLDRSAADFHAAVSNMQEYIAAAGEDPTRPLRFNLTVGDRVFPIHVVREGDQWWANVPVEVRDGCFEWRCVIAGTYDALQEKILSLNKRVFEHERIRPISEAGRLAVARLCTEGRLDAALEHYLKDRCPSITPEAISDVRYRQLMDDACWEIFSLANPEFADSAEARTAMRKHVGTRPLSLPLLSAAYRVYLEERKTGTKPKQGIAFDPVSGGDLEKLSDTDIRQTLTGVRREYLEGERRRRDLLHNDRPHRTADEAIKALRGVVETE